MRYALALSALLFTATGTALAVEDPCEHRDQKNNYVLDVDHDGASTRDGLLETLGLLGTQGFGVTATWKTELGKTLVTFTFNPALFTDAARAEQVKAATLQALVEIEGNALDCNDVTAPGMGVRTRYKPSGK